MKTPAHVRAFGTLRPTAVAAVVVIAALMASASPARADITGSGSYFVYPIAVPLGPDIGANGLVVGNITAGSFSVTAGSLFSGASIAFGTGVTGVGTGLFDGSLP